MPINQINNLGTYQYINPFSSSGSSYQNRAPASNKSQSSLSGLFSNIGKKAEEYNFKNFIQSAGKWFSSLIKPERFMALSEAQNVAYNLPAIIASGGAMPAGISAQAAGEGFRLGLSSLSPELQTVEQLIGSSSTQGAMCTMDAGLSTSSQAATTGGSSILGLGTSIAGSAVGLYNLIKTWGKASPLNAAISGVAAGAGIGSFIPGLGTLLGGTIGGIVGFCSTLFGSKKPLDQKMRDKFREGLIEAGVIDKNWTIGLADGTRYDIGIDGGPKEECGGRRPYEMDMSHPLVGDMIGLLNPLLAVATGANEKLQTSFVGYFVNAAISNADGDVQRAFDNVRAIYSQFNASPELLAQGLMSLAQEGKISAEVLQAYVGGLQDVFSNNTYQLKQQTQVPYLKSA